MPQQDSPSNKKIRIGLIFGGRSGEHEVSLSSANAVMSHLDRNKYEVIPIGITKTGAWLLGSDPQKLLATEQGTDAEPETTTSVTLTGDPNVRRLIPLQNGEPLQDNGALDVIFPVMHGTTGEDGALQGLLEMANVPYVGCGILGSALGMDKEKMKMIFQTMGLPIVDYLTYRRHEWERSPEATLDAIEQRLGYPCFVKPVNLGSSVGINKAHNREELEHAMRVAAEYDRKIIIERGINCRELECASSSNVGSIAASWSARCWATMSRLPQWWARSSPATSFTITEQNISTTSLGSPFLPPFPRPPLKRYGVRPSRRLLLST